MKYYKIEIDEIIWNFLKSHAEPFVDTPNSVLHALLFQKAKDNKKYQKEKKSTRTTSVIPDGIPKALSQILEVIYEVKKSGLSRKEATKKVAHRRSTSPITIIDKYCRQLNKKAIEIDQLLEARDLSEFKLLLEKKFLKYQDVIHHFFQSMDENE